MKSLARPPIFGSKSNFLPLFREVERQWQSKSGILPLLFSKRQLYRTEYNYGADD